MSNTYLIKRGFVYYSRFRIPQNYLQYFDCLELRWSLKTSCAREARKRVVGHREIFLGTLRKVRRMDYPFDLTLVEMKKIRASLKDYMGEQLRLFRGFTTGSHEDLAFAKDTLLAKTSAIELFQQAIDQEDYSNTNGLLSDFLKYPAIERLANMFDQPSENFRWFAELACETELNLYKQQQMLLHRPLVISSSANRKRLSTCINLYLTEKAGKGLSEKSLNSYQTTLKRLIDFLDDPEVDSIEREDMVRYQQALTSYPALLSPSQKSKKIKDLIAEGHEKTLSKTSVNKHLTRASEFFTWLIATDKAFSHNPASKLSTRDDRKPNEERSAFNDENLKSIFSGIDLFQGKAKCSKTAHYWAPLISAYSGMRIEEICQLDVADIKEQDGIWVFDVNDNNEKKLKTKAARRIIPIHSALINLGLIEYRNTIKTKEFIKLFPSLIPCKNNGYSHNPSKWFSRTKKKLGLKETTEVFHSFRHTVSNALKQSLVSEEISDQITGHTDVKRSEGRNRYAKPFDVKILKEAIEKLSFQIDVVPFPIVALQDSEKRYLRIPIDHRITSK